MTKTGVFLLGLFLGSFATHLYFQTTIEQTPISITADIKQAHTTQQASTTQTAPLTPQASASTDSPPTTVVPVATPPASTPPHNTPTQALTQTPDDLQTDAFPEPDLFATQAAEQQALDEQRISAELAQNEWEHPPELMAQQPITPSDATLEQQRIELEQQIATDAATQLAHVNNPSILDTQPDSDLVLPEQN